MALIPLDVAKAHLRITHDREDDDIERKVLAAEAIVLDYIQSARAATDTTLDDVVVTWTPENLPPLIQAAMLIQLAELHRYRGDEETPARDPGDLAPGVKGILRRWRDPVVA